MYVGTVLIGFYSRMYWQYRQHSPYDDYELLDCCRLMETLWSQVNVQFRSALAVHRTYA